MKQFLLIPLTLLCLLTVACSPVKNQINNQYKLSEFSTKRYSKQPSQYSILVSTPQAVSGYQTEQMLYVKKPYELSPFAHNAWVDPPASMLLPLLFQSLQHSNYFKAVSSTPYAEETNYRLDTQLIELQQSFLKRPSVVQISIKVVLSDLKHNKIVGSHIFRRQIPCSQDNPFAGVIATNNGVKLLTADITDYVIKLIQKTAL